MSRAAAATANKAIIHTDCGPLLVDVAKNDSAQQQSEPTPSATQHAQRRSQRLIVKSGGGGRVGNVQRAAALKTASNNSDVDEQIIVQTIEHPSAARDSAVNDIEDDDVAEEKESAQLPPNDWVKMATLISLVLFIFVLLLNLFLDDAYTLFCAFILGTGTVWAILFYNEK